jgi:hypothetical protein
VTLETLQLLQKTVDYLKRLPVVPMTHHLITEIEQHIHDPKVLATMREAAFKEIQDSRRVSYKFTPAGAIAYEIVVEGDKATITVPKLPNPPDGVDRRFELFENGLTLQLFPERRSLIHS